MNLVAVQAQVKLRHYQTPETFRQWVLQLTEGALEGLPKEPTLVAFPEMMGLPLLLTLAEPKTLQDTSLEGAVRRILKRQWRDVLRQALHHRHFSLSAVFLPSALPAYRAYHTAFAEAARRFDVTIVAGSSLLPHITEEASSGLHIVNPKVYNTSFIFSPRGTLLGQSHKIHLTKGLESRLGLARGRPQDLQVMHTPVGRIAVPICLDAFYTSVLDHLDGLGAEIVVMPSANFLPWEGKWAANPTRSEGEAWFKYGLAQGLERRLYLRYGINPMLVGQFWDLDFEGVSSIVSRQADGTTQIVATAKNATSLAFVRATVDVPTLAR
ncbi:MAG: carbon-nitrogen hydrolase family protein [Trueperaceae bacterium]